MAVVLVVLSLFFWYSLAVDYRLSKLLFKFQFEHGMRMVLTVAAVGFAVAALITRVLARMMRDFHLEALALVLERRFPQLNDRLITSVQLGKQGHQQSELTDDLLRRTVDEVADLSSELPLQDVFDFRPLKKVGAADILLVASIAGFAMLFPGAFGTWYRRNVTFANEYWPRESELELVVLSSLGEQEWHFVDGHCASVRGGDLSLLAAVRESRLPNRCCSTIASSGSVRRESGIFFKAGRF